MELMTLAELRQSVQYMALPVFLSFVAIVVLLSDLVFTREDEQEWPAYLTLAGLLGGLFLWVQSWLLYHDRTTDGPLMAWVRDLLGVPWLGQSEALFARMYQPVGFDSMTQVVSLLVVVVALVVTLLAPRHLDRRGIERGEFYALILLAVVGIIIMAGANHLILLFLGLELLSIPLYILAGFSRPRLHSQESALKYFLLGAFASGILLYGIALVYGATGTLYLDDIQALLSRDLQPGQGLILSVNGGPNLMLLAGLGMLLVGLGFKISAAPFHQWTPDVYEGAPTPVTAFMVAATKAGGFAALINVLVAFFPMGPWLGGLIAIIALLTMVVGNVGALLQQNIKRMLAYSSIAHAGYMLVGVAALFLAGGIVLPALLLYLSIYALMNLGAFAVVIALEEATGREVLTVDQFRGLGRSHPVLGFLLGFFLLSLAGFPPTAGFFGKFFLFTAAYAGGQIWLVVVAALLSVISIFYYARFLVAMFMEPADDVDEVVADRPRAPSLMVGTALTVAALLVLGIGLFPSPLLALFQ